MTRAGWVASHLQDVLEFRNGKSIKPGSNGRFPVYGSNGVIGGTDTPHHDKGIVIGRVGAYCGSLSLPRSPFWASDNTIVALPSPGALETRFAFYALRHLDLHRWAGGAAQPLLTQSVLRSVPITLPPIPLQRKIAAVLAAYDELIENNLRRIEILEEMARVTYREWFVDLRFPGSEQHELVDTACGRIPRSWEIGRVGEHVRRLPSGPTYTGTEVVARGRVIVVDQSRSDALGYHDDEPAHVASISAPIAVFGDHTCKLRLMVEPFSLGPNVVPFVSSTARPTSFLVRAIDGLVETREYKRHWTDLQRRLVSWPDVELTMKFETAFNPQTALSSNLSRQNANLRTTRDLLLPKLISGEIDVSDLDIDTDWLVA